MLKSRHDVSVQLASDSPLQPQRGNNIPCCAYGCSVNSAVFIIPPERIVPFSLCLGLDGLLKQDSSGNYSIDAAKCTIEQWSSKRFCQMHVKPQMILDESLGLLKDKLLPLEVYKTEEYSSEDPEVINNNDKRTLDKSDNDNNPSKKNRANSSIAKCPVFITFFVEYALEGCEATKSLIAHHTGLSFQKIISFWSMITNMQDKFVSSEPIVPGQTATRTLAPFRYASVGQLNTFLATMICLKSALPFATVCHYYDVNETAISRWWKAWVCWGSRFFGWLTPLPDLEVINLMTNPDFFINIGSKNVRFIVDGVQIRVQDDRGSTGMSGILHSVTKNCPTINIIHVITTSGMQVAFGPGYGGNFVDNNALAHCGYYGLLKPFEQTLLDRGFLQNMHALVTNHNTNITPPNQHDHFQFSKEDVKLGMAISSERTIVEQAIECVRGNFHWFNSTPKSELRVYVCVAYQMIAYMCNFLYHFGDLRNGATCQYDNFLKARAIYLANRKNKENNEN